MSQEPDYEAQKAELIAELQARGIKHTPENIVRIAKCADDRIVFLETGDEKRGLQHILAKADQFARIGINEDEIVDVVMGGITKGSIVSSQGRDTVNPRPVYQFIHKGEIKYIAVTIGNNGYIVGANPRTKLK
ncbi:hypothetical protein [Planktothrix agardhii]|uniref:hypothetical protein n=1 Tax=Planktothrix agardhii TaxID=1160 RepID=UPI0020A74166|nr:hypothetical protein [Planktothrix agardhii]CAD5954935.1 hypothetical protein NO2A_03265 [Planktothrix agardhii]